MTEPPKYSDQEICPLCKRPKNKHTPDELHACAGKLKEFRKQRHGGAGIE